MAPSTRTTDHEVVIIGAGPGGICAGVRLKQAEINNFVIFERDGDIGGSWRDNRYPQVGVDIPSLFYQYSFARWRWTRMFPSGAEVLAYHRAVLRKFSIGSHIRCNMQVVKERWDEAAGHWELTTATGEVITAKFVLSAVGAFLSAKGDPGLEGLHEFQGKVLRPTDWDDGYDMNNKRVAIIGTGASSVQITPAIARIASHVSVYQRTAVWCFPKLDLAFGPKVQQMLALPYVLPVINGIFLLFFDTILRVVLYTPNSLFVPLAFAFDAIAKLGYRAYLMLIVQDAKYRAALQPRYGPCGKRPTISNHFLQSFNRPNVSLVTTSIERVTAAGIRTTDEVEHRVDALVLATGYHLFSDCESYAVGAIIGREGFDLATYFYEEGLQAYEGVSIPGLPNRWMVVGPYSWTGISWHSMVEISTGHIINVIAEARRRGSRSVEVNQLAHHAYHEKIRNQGVNMTAYFAEVNPSLRTYYVNSQGHIPYVRPTTLLSALRNSRNVNFQHYVFL